MPSKEEPTKAPDPVVPKEGETPPWQSPSTAPKADPKQPTTTPEPKKTDWDKEAAKEGRRERKEEREVEREERKEERERQREDPPAEDAPYQDPTAIPYTPDNPVGDMESRLEALLERRLDMMQRKMEILALTAVERALPQAVQIATNAAAMAANNKPPLTLRANVADNFIQGGGSKSPHLGHYRCEQMKADKLQEFDMAQWRAFERGDVEWPKDKHGRKIKLQTLCVIRGATIPFLDGHCYPTTPNQVECLMLYKNELSQADGGRPGIYEDTSVEPFRCKVCQGSNDTWTTREGFAAHMLHVHGVLEQAA